MWVKGYAVALRIPMSGRDFEELLAELFGRLGFDVELTPSANDYGADLILRFPSRIQHAIAVQAKFYSAPVDNSPVQEVFASLQYYGAGEGWVITNSTFTSNARELAAANGVRLIDGAELNALISHVDMYQDREPIVDALLAGSGFFGEGGMPASHESIADDAVEDAYGSCEKDPRRMDPTLCMPVPAAPSPLRMYNMTDVATRWGCTRRTVEKQIAHGLPMYKQPNGRWGITEYDLAEYERRMEYEAACEAKRSARMFQVTCIVVLIMLCMAAALLLFLALHTTGTSLGTVVTELPERFSVLIEQFRSILGI